MDFGVQINGPALNQVRDIAQAAEAAGFRTVYFPDHLVLEGPERQAQGFPAYDPMVQRFVLGLSANPAGTLLEMNGQPIACVMPMANGDGSDGPVEWTEEKNTRRCDLIDREIAGTLTVEELGALHRLQAEMLRHRRRVAPLPLEEARALHRQLLAKASAATGPGQ